MKLLKGLLVAIALVIAGVVVLPLLGLTALSLRGDSVGPPQPPVVGARATFEESADCLRFWRDTEGRSLNDYYVAECFPTQTAAKKQELIACFNAYEVVRPDHDDWPEENMRGCTWDGLTAVPIRNVASLAFEKVVAVPARPRAGKRFVLRAGVIRTDSAAKVKESLVYDTDNPTLDVAATIDGGNVPLETVEGCSSCRLAGNPEDEPESEYWFGEHQVWVKFTVPTTAAGKRLAIKMAVSQPDTPIATRVVTFTVVR